MTERGRRGLRTPLTDAPPKFAPEPQAERPEGGASRPRRWPTVSWASHPQGGFSAPLGAAPLCSSPWVASGVYSAPGPCVGPGAFSCSGRFANTWRTCCSAIWDWARYGCRLKVLER